MNSLFKIGTINNISNVGLKRFSKDLYKIQSLKVLNRQIIHGYFIEKS